MTEPLLDLVAVTYEAPRETGAFLASLKHIDVPFRLTVIDNASPSETVRQTILTGLPSTAGNCLGATYIFNDENVGYARAINAGMLAWPDPAPYAAILNADVEFLPSESIQAVTDHFEHFPYVGIIGPRTMDDRGRFTHAGIVNTKLKPRNHHRGWLEFDNGTQYRDIRNVNTVSGATYFVRREMWDQLTKCPLYQEAAPGAEGAFLPTKHFYEETFCSYHARYHGWRVVYFGETAMIHKWHRSSPVGSQNFNVPREQFMEACRIHRIPAIGEIES